MRRRRRSLADGQLVWESDPVSDVDVEALLSGPTLDRQERKEADEWLLQILADGPVDSKEIEREAQRAGFSWRTVCRAKQRLGIDAVKLGFGPRSKWSWMLPASKDVTGNATHRGWHPLEMILRKRPIC
jgi:hypothetical protein